MAQAQVQNATTLETSLPQAFPVVHLPAVENPPSENLANLAHDVRNMVTALGLYCDLLDEPGVLLPTFRHYSKELKHLAEASRHLVDRLARMGGDTETLSAGAQDFQANAEVALFPETSRERHGAQYWESIPSTMVRDLAWELESNGNLLAALAGPRISVSVETEGAGYPVRLSSEDLTRVLVNLVKNAVEAMPEGGRLHFSLRESPVAPGEDPVLILDIEDNGPGIPQQDYERIFEPGFTTRVRDAVGRKGWNADHRGLGLSITRSIIEAAGGRIHVANRDPMGACFQIELPVRVG